LQFVDDNHPTACCRLSIVPKNGRRFSAKTMRQQKATSSNPIQKTGLVLQSSYFVIVSLGSQ
jgi:hypothetical protein